MAFFHKPEGLFYGPRAMGIYKYPGFHTSRDEDAVYPYAQLKVRDLINNDLVIPDYPVILKLDMEGLTRLVDYDAMETARGILQAIAEECLENYFDDPTSCLIDWCEEAEEPPSDEIQAMFQMLGRSVYSPAGSLRGMIEDLDDAQAILAFESLASDNPDHELLMDIVGQYRYEEDIDDSRIISVTYMAPIWTEIIDTFEEAGEHRANEIEEEGYTVITLESIYEERLYADTTIVWKKEPRSDARIEYHGTSYRNLISAAPWLEDVLPEPPRPYINEAEAGYLEMVKKYQP